MYKDDFQVVQYMSIGSFIRDLLRITFWDQLNTVSVLNFSFEMKTLMLNWLDILFNVMPHPIVTRLWGQGNYNVNNIMIQIFLPRS